MVVDKVVDTMGEKVVETERKERVPAEARKPLMS